MGDLLREENDSKWSPEVQVIGGRIFFTDIQRCKNFFQHYTLLQDICFFSAGSFFPGYFLARFLSLEISLESRRCPESGKVLLLEYGIQQSFALKGGILGFGTRNTAQGIWNSLTIGIQNQVPLSRHPKCSTWNLETMAWNPETKTVAHNTWVDTLEERSEPPHSTRNWRFIPLFSFFPKPIPQSQDT